MSLLTQHHEEGTTIIMVTHSPFNAGGSRKIINLFDGHVITENKKEEFHLQDECKAKYSDRRINLMGARSKSINKKEVNIV